MGDVIKLGKIRKQRAKSAKAGEAELNRLTHGLTKAEKQRNVVTLERRQRDLDGKKLT